MYLEKLYQNFEAIRENLNQANTNLKAATEEYPPEIKDIDRAIGLNLLIANIEKNLLRYAEDLETLEESIGE